jgi:hypothetical protein
LQTNHRSWRRGPLGKATTRWLLEAHWQARAVGARLVALFVDRDACELLSVLGVAGVVTVVDA